MKFFTRFLLLVCFKDFKDFKDFSASETLIKTDVAAANYNFYRLNYNFYRLNYNFYRLNYNFYRLKL